MTNMTSKVKLTKKETLVRMANFKNTLSKGTNMAQSIE